MSGEKGRLGEDAAADMLARKGYRIIDRNWRCRFGEVDIIAANNEYIVFAEVKLRKNADFAAAREFVDSRKQERLRVTASLFLAGHESGLQPRFDVIEVYAPEGGGGRMRINHLENAF